MANISNRGVEIFRQIALTNTHPNPEIGGFMPVDLSAKRRHDAQEACSLLAHHGQAHAVYETMNRVAAHAHAQAYALTGMAKAVRGLDSALAMLNAATGAEFAINYGSLTVGLKPCQREHGHGNGPLVAVALMAHHVRKTTLRAMEAAGQLNDWIEFVRLLVASEIPTEVAYAAWNRGEQWRKRKTQNDH